MLYAGLKVGAYYSIPDNMLSEADTLSQDLCGDDHLAYTMRSFSAITFCPSTLDGTAGVKPKMTDQKLAIKPNDPIGDHRTMAEMWIHEVR